MDRERVFFAALAQVGRFRRGEQQLNLESSDGFEPDLIRLEESEVRRALSTPDFFLVAVSGVEGVDPLTMQSSSTVVSTGVPGTEHSLVYDLGPVPDEDDLAEADE
jgi:hypothetical protein